MKLTVWGARGSTPVSGHEYVRYGGDTTCMEIVTNDGQTFILDAGTGVRRLGNLLLKDKREKVTFLLTHAHWDHLLGLPFFKFMYRPGNVVEFHGCRCATKSIRSILKTTMQPPFFPVEFHDVAADIIIGDNDGDELQIGNFNCRLLPLSHPDGGCGFIFDEGGPTIAFLPDNEPEFDHPGGLSYDQYVEAFRGVDLLFHDGEYLPREYEAFSKGWGHSIYLETIRLALDAGVKQLVLWHINQDRTDEQADEMLVHAREVIRDAGSDMTCHIAYTGMKFEL
ncbi:MAG: MBL fold metallo-hydrolase [Lentisphaeria bacterium]|nr:MBL fold metallo-hydrolase [Lentisphaeria bacterium]